MVPDRIVRMRILILLCFSAFGFGVFILPVSSTALGSQNFVIHFFDVGQGDATFFETPEGLQVLIDGGRDSSVLRELGKVMDVRDRYIDIVVATHPDSDHIGGLIDVLERYDVGMIVMTENESDTDAAAAYAAAASFEGADIVYARRGQQFALGSSTTIEVLFPDIDPTNMESNASSIVLQVHHGNTSFMLTGDSPKEIEEYLVLLTGDHLQSDVLKVGHHGSRTSTSEVFLAEVDPRFGVISAGTDNSYGHPHVEVTDMLFNHQIETLHTAEEGAVTFMSDGTKVWVE